tara:strand:- start:1410 stop:2291 length:882 start_codon:yes stop_codon:yes gene_type:complete
VSYVIYRGISINKNIALIEGSHYLGMPIQLGESGCSVQGILDGILKLLKYQLSRHNKVIVLRYDVFLAGVELEITSFNQEFIRKIRVNYGLDAKMLWVREKGASEYNNGIHYHYILTIPQKTETSLPNLGAAIKKIANHCLKKRLNMPEIYDFPSEFDIESPIKDKEFMQKPYSSFRGFFLLDRRYITPEETNKQKIDIQVALEKDKGYKHLDISKIKNRNYNKNKALGGVLEECIYAISYLAKLKTKEDLPAGERMFTPPSYTETNLKEGRAEQIAEFVLLVDKAFAMFDVN